MSTYYPFPPSIGGVETIVRNVALELANRGHEVHIITSNLDVTTQHPVINLGIDRNYNVVIHKLKPSSYRIGYARNLKNLKETVKNINPDIIHSHNIHPHLFRLAKLKKELKYKLIAELHYPEIELDYILQKILLKPVMILLKQFSSNIDLFVSQSILEENWLIKNGIPKSKIDIVFTPHIKENLLHIPKTRNENYILYLSRIVPRKGVHILIKALDILIKKYNIKTKLIIAGKADYKYLKEIKNMISTMELNEYISIPGILEEEEKINLTSRAKIFCLPSIADYHPLALIEAQALGTPVVSTKVGAIPEIVINNKTGILVEPQNPYKLAEAIKTIFEDDNLYKKLSMNAKKWAENFTLEKVVNTLEELYFKI